jgi:hypothetical protein
MPAFYTNTTGELRRAKYCTALVERKFLDGLKSGGPVSRITVLPQIDADVVATNTGPPPTIPALERNAKPGVVVIGIVDFGIAFAHQRFRLDPKSTRIEYFWVQDGKPTAGATPGVNPVPYGGELAAPEINDLLSKLADEGALYARAAAQGLGKSWLWSISRRLTHGTHVMDVACGYGLDEAERMRRPIVAVQLPEAATADTSGENLDAYALDAVRYIVDRADAIARQHQCGALPVVINFSWGNVAGPHDGSSDLEQAIDEIVHERRKIARTEVVLPAGNSNLARLHAAFQFEKVAQTQSLRWRVLPDDKTPSFLEIWLPESDPVQEGRVKLRITPPGSSDPKDSSPWLAETSGHGLQWQTVVGAVLCEARYRYIPAPTGRGMFLLALQPTIRADAAAPNAPSGVWTIDLENQSFGPNDLIEAWIQRDDTPLGFRGRGRQSYFDHECYEQFDAQGRQIERDEDQKEPCFVKRAGSINAIATGKKTIVVGGFLRKEGRLAGYSAGIAAGSRAAPRYLAPSDDSKVYGGVLAAGTRSGSVVAMNGTSVAAPQVARWIANQLAESSNGGAAASVVTSDAPEITPDGWSDTSFPGAGIVPHRDAPFWPRPRPGKRAAEAVVYDAQTGRLAATPPAGRPDPAGWHK